MQYAKNNILAAMHLCARHPFAQYVTQFRVCVPTMDHHRQAKLHGQVKLRPKGPVLPVVRRAFPVIIQADLADGHDLRMRCQDPQLSQGRVVEIPCVIGMHANLRIEAGVALGQIDSSPAGSQIDGRVDDGLDATLTKDERLFLYLPFQHSESAADQDRSVGLYAMLGDADARASMAEAGGPRKISPASSMARAKPAFSERKP